MKESASLQGLRAYFGFKRGRKNGADCIMRIFMIYPHTYSHSYCYVDQMKEGGIGWAGSRGVVGNAYRILFGKNGGERSRGEERCVDGSRVVKWIRCESVHWTALL